jgi:hypothetical protein
MAKNLRLDQRRELGVLVIGIVTRGPVKIQLTDMRSEDLGIPLLA